MASINDVNMADAGELQEGFKIAAPGEYTLYMEESGRNPTNANDGSELLYCKFIISGGEFDGVSVQHRFNLWNKSQQAVDIAKSEFRALCEACIGLPLVKDSSELHYKKFTGTLTVESSVSKKDGKEYKNNRLVFRKGSIRPLGPTATPQASSPVPPQASVGASGKPPWAK